MLKQIAYAVMILGLLSLAACGSNRTDRALSGGGIGAGVGAGLGAILGGPIGGALLGAAAGGGLGWVTDEEKIDLGEPLWR